MTINTSVKHRTRHDNPKNGNLELRWQRGRKILTLKNIILSSYQVNITLPEEEKISPWL